jgi:hypothetical protein
VWQALTEELSGEAFVVLAVALDSRPDAARPWIEAASPTYPCLIDRDHRVADLYQLVNVPQAVWIDEAGRIVRPPEPAGAYEGFRAMDRATRRIPPDAMEKTAAAKRTYVASVRDWVRNGARSAFAFDAAAARARLPVTSEAIVRAHTAFRLGQHLIRNGREAEGERLLAEASRLHPDSWAIWRQGAAPNEQGLAAGADFWQRVDALGERRYYPPVDMAGMPD